MDTAKFRFRGYTFPVNPASVRTVCRAGVQAQTLAGGEYLLRAASAQPMEVTGEGMLTGPGARRAFVQLRLLLDRVPGTLFMGMGEPLFAVLCELERIDLPGRDAIGYRFCFLQAPMEQTNAANVTHIVQPGETLWDIARHYGVPVQVLLARNSALRDPWELQEGEAVYLC